MAFEPINPERIKRSVVKSITFRVLVILSDIIVIFLITRRLDITLGIIVIFSNIARTILYYLHERLWSGIGWGRSR